MIDTILIYARCKDSNAKGDYSFAGSIAKDLVACVSGKNIHIVLTSYLDSISKYELLYGKAVNESVSIDGQPVKVCALELLDTVEHNVIGFIEANRCKYASAELIKRVIAPDVKFICIGAGNQKVLPSQYKLRELAVLDHEQPGIYPHFGPDFFMIEASGLGPDRIGLPTFRTLSQLPELGVQQKKQIPNAPYGFMYLKNDSTPNVYRTMAQYMGLSKLNEYVLVGNFQADFNFGFDSLIAASLNIWGSGVFSKPPKVHFYNALDNITMRTMAAASANHLVLSTGVMSTLEVMFDGKLPFYQDFPSNIHFVVSYLGAVQLICEEDNALTGPMPWLIVELSKLLFADKPLMSYDAKRIKELMATPNLPEQLIEVNKTLITKAQGRIAPQLLDFIGKRAPKRVRSQFLTVCEAMRKEGEEVVPDADKALRRAAAWGRIFELKVLIKYLGLDDLNKQASDAKAYTALHWAVKEGQLDCVLLLIQAGVDVDGVDGARKTPLYYAIKSGSKEIIHALISVGNASLTSVDQSGLKANFV